jgi:hypothetical protein
MRKDRLSIHDLDIHIVGWIVEAAKLSVIVSMHDFISVKRTVRR